VLASLEYTHGIEAEGNFGSTASSAYSKTDRAGRRISLSLGRVWVHLERVCGFYQPAGKYGTWCGAGDSRAYGLQYIARDHGLVCTDGTEVLREAISPLGSLQPGVGASSWGSHRVAISNRRLVALDERGVSFRSKDYRAKGKTRYKTMTLSAQEFMRRFRLHGSAGGFHRIRHYGLIPNAARRHTGTIARSRARRYSQAWSKGAFQFSMRCAVSQMSTSPALSTARPRERSSARTPA
jgi:hypothetical protein